MDFASGTNDCVGTNGYDDIGPGTPVVVEDEGSTVVGSTSLGEGTKVRVRGGVLKDYWADICRYRSEIDGLAKAKFYSVEVADRGKATYSFDDLERNGWHVEVSLGDDGEGS